jgi:hypothetical protein
LHRRYGLFTNGFYPGSMVGRLLVVAIVLVCVLAIVGEIART